MALEKRWLAVSARPFTSNGTSEGVIQVASTRGFKVGQEVILRSNTQTTTKLKVKRVVSKIELWVGPGTQGIKVIEDISNFLVADSATIEAQEQPRPNIEVRDMDRATFEEEPTVARRVFLVDELGNEYTTSNPLPTQLSDGSINIETLNANLEVQLSAKDNDPNAGDVHDSVRIGDGVDELAINPDGSINAVIQSNVTVGSTFNDFNNISSVPNSSLTNVLTYTVPALSTLKLCRIEVSGNNIATFEVWINGSLEARKRTIWGQGLNEEFIFETNLAGGLVVPGGQVVQIKVIHFRPNPGDFEARLLGEIF